jgi:hypothetical protein
MFWRSPRTQCLNMATPTFFSSECGELKGILRCQKKKKRFVMYLRNFAQKNLTAQEGSIGNATRDIGNRRKSVVKRSPTRWERTTIDVRLWETGRRPDTKQRRNGRAISEERKSLERTNTLLCFSLACLFPTSFPSQIAP